tara:strand:- start:130 stop:339 length:210 start_codon:yes stop_codon:yes gene_type:complete
MSQDIKLIILSTDIRNILKRKAIIMGQLILFSPTFSLKKNAFTVDLNLVLGLYLSRNKTTFLEGELYGK